jgi:hypothetical protein
MNKKYKIGDLIFTLSGSDPILLQLYKEFSPIRTEDKTNPHIEFCFSNNIPEKIKNGIYVSPVICTDKEIIINKSGFNYLIKKLDDRLFISIKPNLRKDINNLYRKYFKFRKLGTI